MNLDVSHTSPSPSPHLIINSYGLNASTIVALLIAPSPYTLPSRTPASPPPCGFIDCAHREVNKPCRQRQAERQVILP